MARIRSIKPEFWADFPIARLSRDARLLYIALWNFADEHGRLAGDPRLVKGQAFPYDDDLSADAIDVLLDELADAGKVLRYIDAGAPYLHLARLDKHQRLEPGKVPSRFPEPPPSGPAGGPPRGRAHESERRTDKSARGSDESGQISAPQGVDDAETAMQTADAQVSDPSQVRADESARRADESSLLYVAGSREQAAGSSNTRGDVDAHQSAPTGARPSEPLPPQLAILRSKLNARRLIVRWDKLTPDHMAAIATLVDVHGDGPLVKAAVASFRPDSPPVFAQAWLGVWQALPAPGDGLHVVSAPPCDSPGHTGTTDHCNQCASEAKAAR